MKKCLVLFAAVALIAGGLMLVGCSSRDSDLVGTWVFEDNATWVTTFNEDGTGTHAISWGYGTSFRWTTPGNDIMWNYSGHANMRSPYTINGDVLSITMDDGTVFRYIRQP